MIVQFEQIQSIDEIDFDHLFEQSYSRMENTFLWSPVLNTYETRKQFYRYQLQTAIEDKWPLKNEGEPFVMIVTRVDGDIVEFTAGFKEDTGYISLHWHLTSPTLNEGNRNWRYTPESHEARVAFLNSIGVVGTKEYTWIGSLHYRTLKTRLATGRFTMRERVMHERGTPPGGRQLVELTIRLI
jgi:hypothetical protein